MIAENTGRKTVLKKGDFCYYNKKDNTVSLFRGHASRPSERLLFRMTRDDDKIFLDLNTGSEILSIFKLISDVACLDFKIVEDKEDRLLAVFN